MFFLTNNKQYMGWQNILQWLKLFTNTGITYIYSQTCNIVCMKYNIINHKKNIQI